MKVKKAEDRERLADKEDSEHIQRILDIVEDVREEVAAVHIDSHGDAPVL